MGLFGHTHYISMDPWMHYMGEYWIKDGTLGQRKVVKFICHKCEKVVEVKMNVYRLDKDT